MKFSIKDFFSKFDQIRSFLHGKLHFLRSDWFNRHQDYNKKDQNVMKCFSSDFLLKAEEMRSPRVNT